MKAIKKIVICLLIATLSLGGITACGGNEVNSSKLTISFAECGYGREWLVQMLEAFKVSIAEEMPDFTYEIEGDAGITAKLSSRFDTETELSDIMRGLQTNWQMWA